MRLYTPNLWKFQRVLHTLFATQEVPRNTRLHSRGSTRVPPTSRGAPFPPPSSTEGSFPCVLGKEFTEFGRISRGGALHRKGEKNSRVVPPFPETPKCLSPFQGNLFFQHCLDFQSEDRLTQRWHVGQPCGKASWKSLVGKPRGKATDPLIHAKGSVKLLLQLGSKAQVHAPTRDEDGLPWGDFRSTPRSISALERNPQVPAPTPHKILGPGIEGRRIPRGPQSTYMGTGLS